jgi:hypothetical protein
MILWSISVTARPAASAALTLSTAEVGLVGEVLETPIRFLRPMADTAQLGQFLVDPGLQASPALNKQRSLPRGQLRRRCCDDDREVTVCELSVFSNVLAGEVRQLVPFGGPNQVLHTSDWDTRHQPAVVNLEFDVELRCHAHEVRDGM